jgi:hypothetical protein
MFPDDDYLSHLAQQTAIACHVRWPTAPPNPSGTNSVRALQISGHVVTVISARARSALAPANVGIGIPDQSGTLPWDVNAMFPVWPPAATVAGPPTLTEAAAQHG